MGRDQTDTAADSADEPDLNQVVLRGRLGDGAETRELPSGDQLLTFRLTVQRPPGERVAGGHHRLRGAASAGNAAASSERRPEPCWR